MGHAACRAIDSAILQAHPLLQFSSGGYNYTIKREAKTVQYSVSAKGKTLSAEIVWAFGFGSMGQTYLYEYAGALYESQVSYYAAIKGLDLTIGHRNPSSPDLEVAAGRRIDKLEARRCFGCHMTGGAPGVACEGCHKDAREHALNPATLPAKLSKLSNDQLADQCGECHRTWADVQANGPHDINNVRLQPYRLASSKCYNSSVDDKRIGCAACHDPHQQTVKDEAYYDSKCRQCHSGQACKIGADGCVRCHMPKVDFPGGHFRFTDHRIRVVRGSAYPS